ncbi:MAG: 50S ribosomal protein L37ae, partial [Methanobacteriota archaeon]
FGARYGRRVRERVREIEEKLRQHYPCPMCSSGRLKRVSFGVWKCRKCGFTQAGGAYTPTTEMGKTVKHSVSGFLEGEKA